MGKKDFRMSIQFSLKKIFAYFILSFFLSGCAPFVPDNYLSPTTIGLPHLINGQIKETQVIPISGTMLNTLEGQRLLKSAMQPKLYRIGPFDNLDIIVWGHPEISTVASSAMPMPGATVTVASSSLAVSGTGNPPVIVQSDGNIFYPYVGHLQVSGLTLDEAQSAITKRLSVYIRNPQVTVQVAKFRNRDVYVLGEVKNPGMQALTDKPLNLMEAISNAGGINPATADPTHIYIVRGTYQSFQIFSLNAHSAQALLIAEQFPLQENDIVYVSPAMLNAWNNFVNTVLPTFTQYYAIKGLAS